MRKPTNRKRVYGEAREIRDQEWLRLRQGGEPTSAIAERAGVSVQLVRRAIARLRERDGSRHQDDDSPILLPIRGANAPGPDEAPDAEPAPRSPWWLELVPIFPIGSFTPSSECPHRGPIPKGSLACCMVCSRSGVDDHPALKRDPATDPKPEPGPAPREEGAEPGREGRIPDAGRPETRRERRARLFGDREAGSLPAA